MNLRTYLKPTLVWVIVLLISHSVRAQEVYSNVVHVSGTQQIKNRNVTVVPVVNATVSTWCGAYPYRIGEYSGLSSAYEFQFSSAVGGVKFELTATGPNEVIKFLVNGNAYAISPGELSNFPGICSARYFASANAGNIVFTGSNGDAGTTVQINTPVTSVRIFETGADGGTVFNFWFKNDTVLFMKPPADTAFCILDTILVGYESWGGFGSGNMFTVELSDANGSFANPLVIGTKPGTTPAGNIPCVIPAFTSPGFHYRMRMRSTVPARLTPDNGKDLTIGIVKPPKPVAYSNSPVCTNNELMLWATNTQATGLNWQWTGPNYYVSYVQNPVIVHPPTYASGSYIVSAIYNGCKSKDTVDALVLQGLVPITITTNKDTFCAGENIYFNIPQTSQTAVYSWAGPGGFNSFLVNPVIASAQASASGIYTAIGKLNGCYDTAKVNILVKPLPSVNIAGKTSLCEGDTLRLSVGNFSAGANYSWSGPGGYTTVGIYANRNNLTTAMSGNYMLTGMLSGCGATSSKPVAVNLVPPAPVAGSNSPACTGGDIKLTASNVPGAGYEWTGPGGFSAFGAAPVRTNILLTDAGTYRVVAVVNGCPSAPVTTYVNVIQGPEVIIYPNPGSVICAGQDVTFAAVPKNAGSAPVFEWFKNGVSTGATGSSYKAGNVSDGDSIYVRMQAGTACNTPIGSNYVKMSVLPAATPPAIAITAEPGNEVWPYVAVNFKSTVTNAGDAPAYQWKRNGEDIPDGNDSVWSSTSLRTGDTICCEVTSGYECATPRKVLSNCIVMKVNVGVDGIHAGNDISVYPNPNNGIFTLEATESAVLYVSNLQGQLISEHVIMKGKNRISLPVGITEGIYTGRVVSERNIRAMNIAVVHNR